MRTFLHDIESVFWVLVWVVAQRSLNRTEWEVNSDAREMIQDLSERDLKRLGRQKTGIINDLVLEDRIKRFGNDWSNTLAPVIAELSGELQTYLYAPKSSGAKSSARRQAAVKEHLEYQSEYREATFQKFLGIFRNHI